MNESPTIHPVTVSGFYEREDGTVGQYVWSNGRVVLCRVFSGWEEQHDVLADERRMALLGG